MINSQTLSFAAEPSKGERYHAIRATVIEGETVKAGACGGKEGRARVLPALVRLLSLERGRAGLRPVVGRPEEPGGQEREALLKGPAIRARSAGPKVLE